jgi:hypothetical protein
VGLIAAILGSQRCSIIYLVSSALVRNPSDLLMLSECNASVWIAILKMKAISSWRASRSRAPDGERLAR